MVLATSPAATITTRSARCLPQIDTQIWPVKPDERHTKLPKQQNKAQDAQSALKLAPGGLGTVGPAKPNQGPDIILDRNPAQRHHSCDLSRGKVSKEPQRQPSLWARVQGDPPRPASPCKTRNRPCATPLRKPTTSHSCVSRTYPSRTRLLGVSFPGRALEYLAPLKLTAEIS